MVKNPTTLTVTIGAVTEQNRQPEPPQRKPNEDSFMTIITEGVVAAVIADGIPVYRDEEGNYPLIANGRTAAETVVQTAVGSLREAAKAAEGEYGHTLIQRAFMAANVMVRVQNERLGCYREIEPKWLGAVAVALWVNPALQRALIGYIGDTLVFVAAPAARLSLHARDQLAAAYGHLLQHDTTPGYTGETREYQDKHIRNHKLFKCRWCGQTVSGWGGLTGQESALEFVETEEIPYAPKTRYILATDAVTVFGRPREEGRDVADYERLISSVAGLPPQEAADALVSAVRAEEMRRKTRSDDATFVVVDIP